MGSTTGDIPNIPSSSSSSSSHPLPSLLPLSNSSPTLNMSHPDDHLAYGHYNPQASNHPRSGDSARGLVGDTFKKLRDTYKSHQPQPPNSSHPGSSVCLTVPKRSPTHLQEQSYLPQGDPSHPSGPYHDPSYHGHASKPDKLSGLLEKIQGTVVDIGSEVAGRVGTALDPQYAQYGQKPGTTHRFGSFAPPRPDNEVKWYVDGCSYFWAVSRALESARESIWILDCKTLFPLPMLSRMTS